MGCFDILWSGLGISRVVAVFTFNVGSGRESLGGVLFMVGAFLGSQLELGCAVKHVSLFVQSVDDGADLINGAVNQFQHSLGSGFAAS